MLSKCANPGCSAPFLYLHLGKLFRWETERTDDEDSPSFGSDPEIKRSQRRVEFFWLCEDCAKVLTLTFRKGLGVRTQALVPPRIGPAREAAPLRADASRAKAAAS
jgi:hypothetical protein